ncbi:PDR/VanB family oxidoreductase [Spiribacter halobius]|uniref:Oxidoreductase n=1 Tax=Sediminicurvatus halobius TaxID=2182432 RepID=A0A2U2N3G6_9GAMM|nr:PDR/VanB family oxidoreductase [Spiribacter halobius]PWG63524.1 hypothetical protein DEM34_08145 [Spiribacter halobius]UEX79602.1 PDR/VanB family oxidoreductase [Spiribacter halobius]
MQLVLAERTPVAEDTLRLRLAPASGQGLRPFAPGAHLALSFAGLERRYSLTSDPAGVDYYEIHVLRVRPSRGGSEYLHEQAQPGERMDAAGPFHAFALQEDAPRSVFIAGGIGITPFLTMMAALERRGRSFALHYAARRAERLLPLPPYRHGDVHRYSAADGVRLQVPELLAGLSPALPLYVCGPRGLIESVRQCAAALGWPAVRVRFESFGAAQRPGDRPVLVRLARSGLSIEVAPGRSILDALLENGVWTGYECRRGECASCVTEVLAGTPDHRDFCLTEAQRSHSLCTCVSWAQSAELVLDL